MWRTVSDRTSPSIRDVTPALLREWRLPTDLHSKYQRGRVLVIGGAARTPGAVQLAGLAALRVGAGHLTLAVANSAAVPLAVATPEAGVIGLPENEAGSVLGGDLSAVASDLGSADAVVVGPGLDDAEQSQALLEALPGSIGEGSWLVIDAYALGALAAQGDGDLRRRVPGRLVLTPNLAEAELLLGREPTDVAEAAGEIARRYGAVVCCQGIVADPDQHRWRVAAGQGGLATSGSGDVLAGAVAGLLARGADGVQAACWAGHVHAAAGDRLAAGVGRLGFLAREIVDQLPRVLTELDS
jgi:hydroxyethylthiazole kinase-like uncharacterized protein yjeF